MYLKLPIRFNDFFHQEGNVRLPRFSEIESIDQNIELLLTTCPGEHKFNPKWGCRIWDMDFSRVVSRSKWEEEFRSYVVESVELFEPRLKNLDVWLEIEDVVREEVISKSTAIKKRVCIHINATIVSDDSKCGLSFVLYLGPLSTE